MNSRVCTCIHIVTRRYTDDFDCKHNLKAICSSPDFLMSLDEKEFICNTCVCRPLTLSKGQQTYAYFITEKRVSIENNNK